MAKRVLMIARPFPPYPGVGSLRYKGLAKYLPGFGWEPVVLTQNLPGETRQTCAVVRVDYPGNVLRRLARTWFGQQPDPAGSNAGTHWGHRSSDQEPKTIAGRLRRLLLPPSPYTGICSCLIRAARQIIRETPVDALISCSVIDHVVAAQLKREFGVPWIADLRDLWTQNHNYRADPLTRWVETLVERRTFSRVDTFVTVSNPLAERLASFHRDKPVYVIPNGFDPDEFVDVPRTQEFTITYPGSIYRGKQSPELLFEALNSLLLNGELDRNRVRVRFFSEAKEWLKTQVDGCGLTDVVDCCDVVPRAVVLRRERESQLLLLLNWNDPQERGVYTGKAFEYLMMRRPILAVGGPRSVVTELMEQTHAGKHAAEVTEIARAIAEYYHQYVAQGEVPFEGDEEAIGSYTHESMARRFAAVFNASTTPDRRDNESLRQDVSNKCCNRRVIDLMRTPLSLPSD